MKQDIEYQINDDEFIIKNYNNAKPFASFFPAIAGPWGKPMWVFYINRSQSITCMGTQNKDGAILEFLAANKAYKLTPAQGFRTFIKTDNKFYEPFQNQIDISTNEIEQRMHITSYGLKLVEVNKNEGLEISVEYFTIPNENVPSLARVLSIKNISNQTKQLQCIDGLPMIIPYGTGDYFLKNMSRVAESWFSGVIFTNENKIPVYKLTVAPGDSPEIEKVENGNFYAGFYYNKDNKIIFPEFIVDPDAVFGEMKDFAMPLEFIHSKEFKNIAGTTAKNKTPSGMGYFKTTIKNNEVFQYFSVIGSVQKVSDVDIFINKVIKKNYFMMKYEENRDIIRDIGNKILTKSSSDKFDNYCEQTFIDNLLRGGYPITIGKGDFKKNYYIYSRIHGDMEREYNDFVIMPEYFSQGNGSYRDVNQNRRNDVFFNPNLKDEAIIYFMNLIQTDGFNPSRIIGSKLKIKNINKFLKIFKEPDKAKLNKFISSPFSLGNFFNFLEKENIKVLIKKEQLLDKLICYSDRIDYAEPHIGYWSDHWHYNIDLIESYQAIYPENFETLLLKKKIFTFYDNPIVVLPRKDKYVLYNNNNPRQLHAVYTHPQKQEMIETRKHNKNIVRINFGKGAIYKTTLINKLLTLVANKYASLDHKGVGIEMESDKPNWCDALNGLPGLFGSSTAESLELIRLIKFILSSFHQLKIDEKRELKITKEVIDFLLKLEKATLKYHDDKFIFWDKTHTIKEKYWKKTMFGLSGKEKTITVKKICEILDLFKVKLNAGISKAFNIKTGVIYTYFENEVTKYEVIEKKGNVKKNINNLTCIRALKFRQKPLPLFLEGPVHYMRIEDNKNKVEKFHDNVMRTGLYDKKLKMLKVNAPLEGTSINLGRIKVFTPGWLENESIWLHMEYKYLLELLKNNLTEDFYKIMKDCFVPFMDPYVYGRSIFENVSFIVSSAHPEKSIWGQGFVARLSGSTAEFISMWLAITSGLKPFYLQNNKLCLKFKPQIASWLFTDKQEKLRIYNNDLKIEEIIIPDNSFLFKFLGQTVVIYHNPLRKNTFGSNGVKIKKIKLIYFSGKICEIDGDTIHSPYSYDIREAKVKRIHVSLN